MHTYNPTMPRTRAAHQTPHQTRLHQYIFKRAFRPTLYCLTYLQAKLIEALHPAYNTVNVAFAGFDSTGAATNLFDTKTWTLTAADVAILKRQTKPPRQVLLSVGGGDGAILNCNSAPTFVTALSASLLAMVKKYGFDGIDFDIEHRYSYTLVEYHAHTVFIQQHHRVQVTLASGFFCLFRQGARANSIFAQASGMAQWQWYTVHGSVVHFSLLVHTYS